MEQPIYDLAWLKKFVNQSYNRSAAIYCTSVNKIKSLIDKMMHFSYLITLISFLSSLKLSPLITPPLLNICKVSLISSLHIISLQKVSLLSLKS